MRTALDFSSSDGDNIHRALPPKEAQQALVSRVFPKDQSDRQGRWPVWLNLVFSLFRGQAGTAELKTPT